MAFISSGTTILDNGAFSVGLGSQILISEQTASGSASISFTTGIDSTYDIYKFEFIDIHPSILNGRFSFNASIDGGSNYNVTKTTTYFRAYHAESDSETGFNYNTAQDLAQSTSDQQITPNLSNNNDGSASGYLQLFNPSSTTYVKHFISQTNSENNAYSYESFIAGYCNTTSAINAITFKMNTGNIDDGTIKMYGIKGS